MVRKIRRRGAAPPNWKWRGGHPRWEPGPGLRRAHWKGRDLKDGAGAWLSQGASIDAANLINEAVAVWRAGRVIAGTFADIAPPGAAEAAGAPRIMAAERNSIGALWDAYLASNEFGQLGAATQVEYRSKLKRLVDTLAGFAVLPGKGAQADQLAAYAAAVAGVRAFGVTGLLPPENPEDGDPHLYTVYWTLRRVVGLNMANGTLRVAGLWLEWCRTQRRALPFNPARDVARTDAEGRLRPATMPELQALVEAAEAAGYPSIADSIILGVDLSWRQGDRLKLTWPQISPEGRVRASQAKTNRPVETALLKTLGLARLPKIKERQETALGSKGARYTHVIVCETTKAPWGRKHYSDTFAEIRAAAALTCPSVADVFDKDWRATAVGVAYDAGLSPVEIAGRTGHSLRTVGQILDRHYGVISRDVGDRAARRLNAHMKAKGISL